jgi:hypothetical protein
MCNIEAGDTLIIDEPGTTLDSHLWVVISDPAQAHFVLLVNFTSYREDKDLACVLDAGDHPFIKHKTCVNYIKAKLIPIATYQKILASPNVSAHVRVKPEILQRIRNGVLNSRMEMGNYQFLVEQGVLPEE